MTDSTASTISRTAHRCPACSLLVDPIREGDDLVSYCCDEVVERVWMCRECDERETHSGCEVCFPCLVDSVIADPRELESCAPTLQTEVARELANRLRPFLRQRQAA